MKKSDPDAKITDPSETLTPYTVDRLMDEITNDKNNSCCRYQS